MRSEDQKATKRLVFALVGTLATMGFLFVFGLKILVGFSLFIDKIRGNSPASSQTQNILLPPTLDFLPEATNSAQITVSGHGQAELTAIIYVNDAEAKKLTIEKDGVFSAQIPTKEGLMRITAKIIDDKGNGSELSQEMRVTIMKKAPLLEVISPNDNATVSGENGKVEISGKVEDEVQVTVNDRFVVVKNDGSFTYSYPLPEGDTILRIVATDTAGNQTKIERKVTYKR